MKIGELFVFLGFKVDDKQLKDFDRNLQGLAGQLDLTKVAAVAALYAVDRFIESSIAGAVAMYNFTQQTGLSAQALQQWQVAASAANPALGIDQIAASIQTLENNLLEIRKFGSGNASPFAWLQIDIAHGQTAIDVLEQLRDRVQNIDRATAVNLIQKMGLNPGFINILTKSREEFDLLIKSMSRSDRAIETLQKLGERIAQLKLNLVLFKDNLVFDFAPIINKIIDGLEWFGRTISYAYNLVKDFAQESSGLFQDIAIGLGILYAALNPIKTLIAGILLLLADLYVYKKGGQSVIGEILGSDALSGVVESIRKVQSGELKKITPQEREIIDMRPGSGSVNNNRNVTINNDIDIHNPDKTFDSEAIVNKFEEQLNQIDLNYSYTDQQYKGGGY